MCRFSYCITRQFSYVTLEIIFAYMNESNYENKFIYSNKVWGKNLFIEPIAANSLA